MRNNDNIKSMLQTIREANERSKKYPVKPLVEEKVNIEKDNFLTRSKILMEELESTFNGETLSDEYSNDAPENNNVNDEYVIKTSDTQFGNFRTSQEDMIRKTIGDVEFADDALIYYPKLDDIALNGVVKGLNIKFQFRLNDGTGDGVYVTMANTQLSDANTKTIEKIRSSYQNFKSSITEDGKFMNDLKKAAERAKDN